MPIRLEDHLFDLEEKFWTEGPSFYESRLAYTALMVFPEPAGVLLKDAIAPSLAQKSRWGRWSWKSIACWSWANRPR